VGSSDLAEFGERRLFDTTVFRVACSVDLFLTGVFRLRERIHSFIVIGIVLLFLGSNMVRGPIINRCSPVTIQLNSKSVLASHDLEETLFTPMATPGILDTPVWNTVLLTPTDDSDLMVS